MSEPVSFTFNSPGKRPLDLSGGRTHKSRETCGIWHLHGLAWKIFPTLNQYDKLQAAYQAARNTGLPIPTASELFKGRIGYRNGRFKDGFALASEYISAPPARFFAMKTGKGTFERLINSIADDSILSRIDAACDAALAVGLRDPQGFIKLYDHDKPIVFIDLHTAAQASGTVHTMSRIVTARRTSLQR